MLFQIFNKLAEKKDSERYKTIVWPHSPQITYLILDQSQVKPLSYWFAAMKLGEGDFILNPKDNNPGQCENLVDWF